MRTIMHRLLVGLCVSLAACAEPPDEPDDPDDDVGGNLVLPESETDDKADAPGARGRVLVIISSADTLRLRDGSDGSTREVSTGFFLNELGATLRALDEAGFAVDVATPGGVVPTVDVNGFESYFYKIIAPLSANRTRDDDVSSGWRHLGRLKLSPNQTSAATRRYVALVEQRQAGLASRTPLALEGLDTAALDRYAGVYVPGGHAPKVDLLYSAAFARVLRHFHERGRPTALICHAPVTLLSTIPGWRHDRALDAAALAAFPYRGYRVTIGNVAEEKILETFLYLRGERLRFYVEPELREAGMRVETLRVPSTSQVVEDRELLTGANPASTRRLAERFVAALERAGE